MRPQPSRELLLGRLQPRHLLFNAMTPASDVPSETCPDCGSPGVPIYYGEPPNSSYLTAVEHGRLVLGGDMTGGQDMPRWACSATECSQRWHGPDPLRAIQQAVRHLDG